MHNNETLRNLPVFSVLTAIVFVALIRLGIQLFSFDLDQNSEALSLFGILKLIKSETLYPMQSSTSSNFLYLYTPIHALIVKAVLAPFPNLSLGLQILIVRGLSLLFLLCLFRLLYRRLKPIFGEHSQLGLLLLAPLWVILMEYGTAARNDILCLLIEFGVLGQILIFIERPNHPRLLLILVGCGLILSIRPSSIGIPMGFMICLLSSKELKFYRLISFSLIGLFLCLLPSYLEQTSLYTHIFLANQMPRKFPMALLSDPSTMKLLCYFGFYLILVFRFLVAETPDPKIKTQKNILLLSLVSGISLWISRQWSDWNYLFGALLVAAPLISHYFFKLLQNPRTRIGTYTCIAVQSFLVLTLSLYRLSSLTSKSLIPYKEVSEYLIQYYPERGIITGPYSASLANYTSHWNHLGPEMYEKILQDNPSFTRLRHFYDQQLLSLEIPTVVEAGPNVFKNFLNEKSPFHHHTHRTCVTDWFCIYTAPVNFSALRYTVS